MPNTAVMPAAAPATKSVLRSAELRSKSWANNELSAPPVMMIGPSAPNGPPVPMAMAEDNGLRIATFFVGQGPRGVAFDGTYIWTANNTSGTVTRIRVSDGSQQGTFTVGSLAQGIAFDGANVWVANQSGTVTKL